jgi:hypothetical protein
MAATDDFYLKQADICGKAALDTTLPNLREKYLRSQSAWQLLADREIATRAAREVREAGKAHAAEDDLL